MSTATCPRPALRDKLALLGVPREAHERGRLARLLPIRSGTPLDDVDADALAEALIYLIDKEIIRLPCRVEGLMEFGWGSHVCHLYRSREDLLEFLTAYFRHGLESGEYCVWVAPDLESAQVLHAALGKSVPDFALHAQAIECLDYTQWYLDELGALKPAEVLVDDWARKAEEAVHAGFHGLRCAAQTPRIDRKNWSRVAEYEWEAHRALPAVRIKAVCAYPLLECGARHFADMRMSHEAVLAKGEDWWNRVCAVDAAEANAVLMALQEGRP